MKITAKTKYRDFAPFEELISQEDAQAIMQAAEDQFKPCHTLTMDEFWGVVGGNYELLGNMKDPSVLQIYWLKRFKVFCEEFGKACEVTNIKDPDMNGTDSGCVKLTPQEGMLIFARSYFGLPSFIAAGKITIGEYMIARKDHFNTWRMRKNYEAMQIAKMRSKNKSR